MAHTFFLSASKLELHPGKKMLGNPAGIPATGIPVYRARLFSNTRGYVANGFPFRYPWVTIDGLVQ